MLFLPFSLSSEVGGDGLSSARRVRAESSCTFESGEDREIWPVMMGSWGGFEGRDVVLAEPR